MLRMLFVDDGDGGCGGGPIKCLLSVVQTINIETIANFNYQC